MFQRTYKVQGEDVNDFMVMQNRAYLKYASKIVETFLFVNGFTRLKMNKLQVGLQNSNDQITRQKNLLFTQGFSVKITFDTLSFCQQKMTVTVAFFNQKEELCATVIRDLFWFDYKSWQAITPPKNLTEFFTNKEILEQAS